MSRTLQCPVLVTGGTGFLGRALVERLLAKGQRVRVIGRRPVVRWRHNPNVEHLRIDLADPNAIVKAIDGVENIYHLAAATEGDWNQYERTTIAASATLMEAVAARGVRRIVFTSSLGNYDGGSMRDDMVIDENFPLEQNPAGRGFYARAKTESELMAQRYLPRSSPGLTIVRPGIIYGPGMKNPLAGVAFSIKGRFWVIAGSGDKPLPLIHIDDVVDALEQIMNDERAIGRIYNLVDPRMPTQNEYLTLYQQSSGDTRRVVRVPLHRFIFGLKLIDGLNKTLRSRNSSLSYMATRLLRRVYYSSDTIKRDLGYTTRVGLDEGLKKMFQPVGMQ